jgi:hypothetical protein
MLLPLCLMMVRRIKRVGTLAMLLLMPCRVMAAGAVRLFSRCLEG